MRGLLIILFWIISLKLCAKDNLLVIYNLNDCDACNAFINNIEGIDTSNVKVTFVFLERYTNDKEDLIYMLGLKNVKVDYIFNDSVYSKFILNDASSYVFSYNGLDYYYNYLKNGLQSNIISNINNLYKEKTVYAQNMAPLSNTINYLKQCGHEIYYIHPLRNTINKISLIEGNNEQSLEVIKFDKELIAKAYRKIFNSGAFSIQNEYLSNNNLEMSITLVSMYKDSIGNLWVASSHQVLLYSEEYQDTVLTNLSGLYKFDLDLKYIDFYPIHSIKDIDSLKFQFESKEYVTRIYDFFIYGNELVSNVGLFSSSSGLPNYYYGRTSLNKTGDVEVVKNVLPENYNKFGYNFSNLKIGNDKRFYTLQLDDAIYFFEDRKAPIRLNLFKAPTQRDENKQFNNFISTPVYFNEKLYFTYRSDDDNKFAIFNLADNKIEKTKDIANYPEIVNCKRWSFYDITNPNYYLFINEDGYLQRISVK